MTELSIPNREQTDLYFYEELYHDLKTPITILLAYIQLIERISGMPSQAVQYIKEARRHCFRLAKLIRDANDGARLSKGMMLPQYVSGDMVSLVRGICDDACVLTDPRRIQIRFENRQSAIVAAVDRQITERILLNLLSNAKQYSHDDGVIDVSVWESAGNAFISVRDYGPGVPPGIDIFKRSVSQPSRGTHSGLGLYIVRELALLLGGDAYLTDAAPGTEIVVRLPVFQTDCVKDEPMVDDFFYDNMVQMELSW